ncbi:RNase HII [Breoghania corrubedonensis]|uniref:Ribonuclease HII n=1 Tax=Breoghania corrubedonensis TaxID=665038 RepID=A0A2T5VES3_9HYPH|nr:ribonuclease HII [Breoghania corrubedonensis]PTW62226.1 RNase HII [Breoghania corrubedonensis]
MVRSPASPNSSLSRKKLLPTLLHEKRLARQHHGLVAGIDEAGRGPWAGPVVVAAVILDPRAIPEGLNDSKKLSEERREALYGTILSQANVGIVLASPARIDAMNIRAATLWAMRGALCALSQRPAAALFDGRDVPDGLPCPGEALIGGDAASLSVAAASIVAKVTRDRLMVRLSEEFPGYGFSAHKGYGTPQHQDALARFGPCPHHRCSFAPIRALLEASGAPT